jgi:CBS domain-containing protein
MATVKDLLAIKGTQVHFTGPDTSALDAALLMNEHKIGSLVVIDDGTVLGIVTERDILRRVVVERLDPAATPVRDVMTPEVACCQPHTSLDEARGVLKNRRIRHLPVMDECEQLIGLISIGDLNAYQSHEQEHTICVLQEYIYGRV